MSTRPRGPWKAGAVWPQAAHQLCVFHVLKDVNDLVLDAVSSAARRYAEMATLLVSIFICSVLAYFSLKNAYQLWLYDDVTMSPPYFKTWPSAAAIPLGYALISVRMYIQVLHLYDPDRFPANEPAPVAAIKEVGGFHTVE